MLTVRLQICSQGWRTNFVWGVFIRNCGEVPSSKLILTVLRCRPLFMDVIRAVARRGSRYRSIGFIGNGRQRLGRVLRHDIARKHQTL
jgi:hypothetical protein